jgi:hypothetical protein
MALLLTPNPTFPLVKPGGRGDEQTFIIPTKFGVLSFPKIPLNPPFSKGEVHDAPCGLQDSPSESRKLAYLKKGGQGGFASLLNNVTKWN